MNVLLFLKWDSYGPSVSKKPKIISEFFLKQLRVPAAVFWVCECVDNRKKVNEEMEGESKFAVQFIGGF